MKENNELNKEETKTLEQDKSFKCGKITVKVRYKDTDKSFVDCLNQYFSNR